MDGLADRSNRLGEILDAMNGRDVSRLEMDFRDALIVAPDEAEQDLGKEPSLLAAEPTHDAEIDRDDPAHFVDEEVSLVHVGVKESVPQRVPEKRLDQRPCKRPRIDSQARPDALDRRAALLRSTPSS